MDSDQPLIVNRTKDKLKAGEPIFGVNIFEALTPSVVKIAANAGFDMLMVDAEHAINDDGRLSLFLTLVRDNGMAPVVTVIAPERALVSRVLDAGAMGIILSHSETPEQMQDLVRWVKYAPEGERGLAMGANASYDISDVARYCREANDAILILPKIESPLGVENAGAMMDVEGVDGVVFGPGDLSAKMGHPGQWEHPEVLAAINSVVDAAIARGLAVEPPVMPSDHTEYEARAHTRRTHLRRHQANRIRPLSRCARACLSRLSLEPRHSQRHTLNFPSQTTDDLVNPDGTQVVPRSRPQRRRICFDLAVTDDQHVVDLHQLSIANLRVHPLARIVDLYAQTGFLHPICNRIRVVIVPISNRHHHRLCWRQPQRKVASEMLDQHPDEALQRAQHRAVNHHRTLAPALRIDILQIKPLRLVEIDLNRSQLPLATERIRNEHVDLGTIESSFSQSRFILAAAFL